MRRSILTVLLAGVTLLGFAVLPPMLPGSKTLSLSGFAQAQTNTKTNAGKLNTPKSNNARKVTVHGWDPKIKQGIPKGK